MCAIGGFIGESTNPSLTYDLITNVFSKMEARGKDASGFWGVNNKNQIIYHKEPLRSSEIVKSEMWKKVAEFAADLLLIHARQASYGEPRCNKNNHPFTSTDRTLSLIHNGRISEYDNLKQRFQVTSECDSEILLRIIETSADKLTGIKNVFSLINEGHMAVAVGEKLGAEKHLWLFRNQHRSLWVVDLRKVLGQIFFCSTFDIWQDAVTNYKSVIRRQKLIELPCEEVWSFNIDSINRYQVVKDKPIMICDNDFYSIKNQVASAEIICDLDEQEELVSKKIDNIINNMIISLQNIRRSINRQKFLKYLQKTQRRLNTLEKKLY